MGKYIEWDDVVDRYPELESLGGADELAPVFIQFAEANTEALLRGFYTIPFSSNNITVKDLCIDCAFWRAGRLKLDDAVEVKSEYYEQISMIKNGMMAMVDSAGNEVEGLSNPTAFSTTQSYHSSFGMDDPIEWLVDWDRIEDDMDSRD